VLGAALLAAHELETPPGPRPDAISGTASPGASGRPASTTGRPTPTTSGPR
jgi:hypothetical protein